MVEAIDLKGTEEKVRRIMGQDGLDLIVGGLALALVAVFFVNIKHGWAYVVAVGLHASLLPYLRKKIVYPRMGYARLPTKKMTILQHIVTVVIAAVALILFYIFGKESHLNWIMPFYVGVVLSFMSFVTALRHRLLTYYVVAVIFCVSGIIGIILTRIGYAAGIVTAVQLWILSVILVAVGLVRLLLFKMRYPVICTSEN
ncbi:MAG: hypothetical protein JSV98_10810 [candidate division WOR-3 bacterium]|nr:MAG: hypothetical protein JSV98_10810 [candidate division WOR-3 bacterium]